jgi:hypothetical protein
MKGMRSNYQGSAGTNVFVDRLGNEEQAIAGVQAA